MERVIFSVIFFMMLGVPFYLLYKIARDIFGTAGAGEPAQLPQGKQRRSGEPPRKSWRLNFLRKR